MSQLNGTAPSEPSAPAPPNPFGPPSAEAQAAEAVAFPTPTDDGGEAAGAPDPTPAQSATAPDPVSDELQQLSDTFGVDFSGFSSLEDARAAAHILAEGYATAGYNVPQGHHPADPPAFQGPAAPGSPPAQQPDEEIDFSDLDPKTAKYIKSLGDQFKTATQQFEQMRAQQAAAQQAQVQAQIAQVQSRANAVIDGMQDPRYGVGQNATFAQQVSRRTLMQTADQIINGLQATGRPVPVIEKVIHMAATLHGDPAPAQKTAAAAPFSLGANPGPTMNPHTAAAKSRIERGRGREGDDLLSNDQYMAGARAILNRHK